MTKNEIYNELSKFDSEDMILVDGAVIICNSDLNDDWFNLVDYDDEGDIGTTYNFLKVTRVDLKDNFEKFTDEDGNIYDTIFSKPAGCVSRYYLKQN